MKLRPYSSNRDGNKICTWIDDMRMHTLWCANRFTFPMILEQFDLTLMENERDWKDCAFAAVDDNKKVIGFFCYSFNTENKVGFIKFFIVSPECRSFGLGGQMLNLALKYAKEVSDAHSVQLNVFDTNIAALNCYKRKGFIEKSKTPNAFEYKDEKWSRVNLWYFF